MSHSDGITHALLDNNRHKKSDKLFDVTMYKGIGVLFLAVCALIFVGVIGNYHTSQKPFAVPKTQRFKAKDYREGISNKLIENVNSENIKKNLRTLTEEPHPAGTKANLRVAEKIAHIWKENGLEDVHFVKYDVLLSYPNYSSPNYMTIYNEADNSTVYRSEGVTPVVIPEEQGAKGAGVQWVAYSASGVVEGDVVYCHYGNEEDFRRLESLGISVRGKIALLRYGYEFRGDKVNHAQLNGAIGAILYSDPGEAAREGTNPEHVYPKTEWMPGQAVQRGSIMHLDGDPLSPLYPSRSDIYHSRTVEEARKDHVLPSIPVIPLGYHDAYQILSRLSGRPAPHEWSGGLNVTYNLGPGFSHHNEKLRIEVNGEFDKREIQNVVGYIRGADDPDHYVILGNHFDAWVYGSVDPNSGTAILAEVARAMVQTMKETDWRPARTIMFCNWDAEEYGLIGSTEFVEDFSDILSDRAVAYLNVDLISANQTLRATAVPSMYNALVDAAKRVPNPMREQREQGLQTVYDQWYKSFPGSHPVYKDFPNIPPPNGGSDHVPFFSYLAIPVVDFTYSNASTDQYPLYHTLYETPFFNEHIFDHDNFSVEFFPFTVMKRILV